MWDYWFMSTTRCKLITTRCRLHGTSTTAFHTSGVLTRRYAMRRIKAHEFSHRKSMSSITVQPLPRCRDTLCAHHFARCAQQRTTFCFASAAFPRRSISTLRKLARRRGLGGKKNLCYAIFMKEPPTF